MSVVVCTRVPRVSVHHDSRQAPVSATAAAYCARIEASADHRHALQPGPEGEALFRQVADGGVAGGNGDTGHVPQRVVQVVGRRTDLDEIYVTDLEVTGLARHDVRSVGPAPVVGLDCSHTPHTMLARRFLPMSERAQAAAASPADEVIKAVIESGRPMGLVGGSLDNS